MFNHQQPEMKAVQLKSNAPVLTGRLEISRERTMRIRKIVMALAAVGAGLGSMAAQADIILDLRSGQPGGPYASGTINDATYIFGAIQPAGSGTLESFVRVSTNDPTVQGYNTTANNVFDTGNTDTFNHEITVGQVGFIDKNGDGDVDDPEDEMHFALDINQVGSPPNSYLSLDEVQVFLSTSANQSVATFAGNGEVDLASRALVYRMDAAPAGNGQVLLDYDWNSGSGETDMTLILTRSMFEPAFAALGLTTPDQANGAFIYLYSKFGLSNPNNDGYEEWAYKAGAGFPVGCIPAPENNFCQPQQIPEPGPLSLVALGLLGAALARGRRRSN